MEGIHAIQKRSLYREEIKKMIKEAINSGELRPGDRVVETQWAKQLGVSQSPVREAIRDLETEGLIESIPYQGSYVRKVTRQDVKDFYRVRMALEPVGTEDACRLITDEQLEKVKHYLDAMMSATARMDQEAYIENDTNFHNCIMEVSDNNMLKRLWRQCNIREWTYFGTKFSSQMLDILAKRHTNIYNALLARDVKTATYEARKHIEELLLELEERMKQEE